MKTAPGRVRTAQRLLCLAAVVSLAAGLAGCGEKKKEPGQSVASIDGEEITVLQVNDEMSRANVPAGQQGASKQMIDALIDRQVLVNAALKEKLDRDPKVLQSVERAKALVLAQSYLQKHVTPATAPTKAEIEEYYNKHPGFFSQRKLFEMRQLVIAAADLTPALNAAMDSSKSLEEVAAWLESHQVKFSRAQLNRSSSDLPAELGAKLMQMNKGQLFIVREGQRALLITLVDIKDAPVTLEGASQQIAQFLFNKKNKESADAEVARLRAQAKIDYLNVPEAPAAAKPAGAPAAAPVPAAAPAPAPAPAPASAENGANERGVAGLK